MKEQKKKILIAALLSVSCLICGYLLFSSGDYRSYRLNHTSTADSLIQDVIAGFDIQDRQLDLSSTSVKNNFKRKTYYLGLPYQFSKTQFHAELSSQFHPYDVRTPAKVDFPEKDFTIHLLYNDTVIRTILLQTDPKLTAKNKKQISLLVTFNGIPSASVLNQLKQLGEPIPIVLKTSNPLQANRMRESISKEYSYIIYWMHDNQGTDIFNANLHKATDKLTQLQKVLPNPAILFYSRGSKPQNAQKKRLITKSNVPFVDATDALMLHEQMGKNSFAQSLEQLQLKESASMAVINGNQQTLNWLNQQIPKLKKGGIEITPPPQENK